MVWFYRIPTSVYQCQAWQKTNVSCDPLDFGTFEPNADVAGYGVVLSFEIALGLTIVVTIAAIIVQALEYFGRLDPRVHFDADGNPLNAKNSWRQLLDGFLVGLSDTQGVTGLALLLVTLFNSTCGISVYHYDLICDLVLMSLIVHFCSMTVISHYFNILWLAIVRVILIGGNLVLGFILLLLRYHKNFPVTTPSFDGLPLVPSSNGTVNGTTIPGSSLVLSAVCFMDNSTMTTPVDKSSQSTVAFVEYIFLIISFVASAALSLMHTHWAKQGPGGPGFSRTPWTYWTRAVLSLAALLVSGILMYQVTNLQDWMKTSGWFGDNEDESDRDSFGQLVPLIMLALPFLALFEAAAAKFLEKNKTITNNEKRDSSDNDNDNSDDNGNP